MLDEGAPSNSLLGLSQRLPPSNVAAEQALLGAILANNKAFYRVAEFLRPEHFADPVHARIFAAIERRVTAAQLCDPLTLRAELEHSGVLDEVGGFAYLGKLLTAMVGIISAGEYGRAVHDTWLRRQLIDLGETVVNMAFGADPDQDGNAVLGQALEGVLSLGEQSANVASSDLPGTLDDIIATADAASRGVGPTGLQTGITCLDRVWRGLWGGLRGWCDINSVKLHPLSIRLLCHLARFIDSQFVHLFHP